MQRDGQEVPAVVVKCTEAVEASGLKSVGLYRISGTGTQIQRLKSSFDRSKFAHNVYIKANEVYQYVSYRL
jgi:hypothetical protein